MEAVRMSETKNGKKRSLTKCDSKKAKGKKKYFCQNFLEILSKILGYKVGGGGVVAKIY